jgi:apolipoprotein N-acyltransferase
MAQMRAVENRRFVIRAANTGISAIISDKGRIMKQLGEGEVGIVEGKVIVNSSLSAYSRIGESWLILGFALWLILTSFRVHHDCEQDIRGIC